MLYLPGGGAMLFLTDVDHVSFEKVKGARQNNLQSATVSRLLFQSSHDLHQLKKALLLLRASIILYRHYRSM